MTMAFNNQFFDDLSRSQPVIDLVDSVTEAIAETARATAPVGETGEYRDGISTAGKLQRRYVGLVIASDEKSMLVEAKTGNLARALRAHAKGRRRG